MFHDHLIEIFGDVNGPLIAQKRMDRKSFDRFCEVYKENQVLNKRMVFKEMEVPL